MKKELGILGVGLLVGIMLVLLFNMTTIFSKAEPPKSHLGSVKTLYKDVITFNCNDAVMVKFDYAYPVIGKTKIDSTMAKNNARVSLKNFTQSKSSDYFYKLETPHTLTNGIIIFEAKLEARVLNRYKEREDKSKEFIDILITEIDNENWDIIYENGISVYKLKKGDFNILISNSYFIFANVRYKDKDVQLSEKEEMLVIATALKKIETKKLSDNEKIRKEIIEKFGKY